MKRQLDSFEFRVSIIGVLIALTTVSATGAIASDEVDFLEQCRLQAGIPFFPDRTVIGRTDQDIDVAQAIPACKAAVEQDPKSGYSWALLGRAYVLAGRAEEARAAFERSLESGFVAARLQLVFLGDESPSDEAIIAALEEAAADGYFPAAFDLAVIVANKGDIEAATKLLEPLVAEQYPPAELATAYLIANQGIAAAERQIEELLLSSAESGFVDAMVDLADPTGPCSRITRRSGP